MLSFSPTGGWLLNVSRRTTWLGEGRGCRRGREKEGWAHHLRQSSCILGHKLMAILAFHLSFHIGHYTHTYKVQNNDIFTRTCRQYSMMKMHALRTLLVNTAQHCENMSMRCRRWIHSHHLKWCDSLPSVKYSQHSTPTRSQMTCQLPLADGHDKFLYFLFWWHWKNDSDGFATAHIKRHLNTFTEHIQHPMGKPASVRASCEKQRWQWHRIQHNPVPSSRIQQNPVESSRIQWNLCGHTAV